MVLLASVGLVVLVAAWMAHAVRAVEGAPGLTLHDPLAARLVDFSGFVDLDRAMR